MTQTNLPLELSSFHGRDAELSIVSQAVDDSRLVTLTGAGGVGKTRLALRVARQKQFGDGIWWVELAAVSRADAVAVAVARALDLREEARTTLADMLVRELAGRELLLILDNCEHVLDACTVLIERLLKDAPRLRILATSREHLGVSGEVVRAVSPLATEAGVALFCERAGQIMPDLDPAKEQARIEAIVDRLDGLPLAIELAAARMRVLSPSQILTGLDDRFRLLAGGARSASARQKTLRASVAWSYDLLDQDEQILAQRLSVLHGFTLETAAVLGACEQVKADNVLDTVSRLVDRSLLQVDQSGEKPRFRFLETVRQFLLNQLRDADLLDVMAKQHLAHFLTLAEELAPRLALSDGPECLARLQAEFDNLEDALACAAKLPDADELLRLLVALSLFYELRGHFGQGSRWFELALSQNSTPSVLRARALWGAAHVCFYGGRYAVSATHAQQALKMAQEVDDEWSLARSLNTVGVLQALSTPVLARETLLQSVSVGRSIGDDWAIADGLKMVTVAWYVLHDEKGAGPAMAQLEEAGSALGSRFFLAWHQAMVGYFARDRGDLGAAAKAFELSLDHSRYVGDPSTGGFAEVWSAALDGDRGEIDRARARLSRLLASAVVAGSGLAVPE
ncbi:MAG: hypothetical protein HOH74_12055, partial [Gemmatimonadetes bacterium]|nr:hypothetical protein [Gemmatimonadota bacterium]